MDLIGPIRSMQQGLVDLWDCLLPNRYPSIFVEKALRVELGPKDLSKWLLLYVGVYFLCAVISLLLRHVRGQQALCRCSTHINTAILTLFCTLLIPTLILFTRAAISTAKILSGYQGSAWARFSNMWTGLLPYIFVILVVAFTIYMPIHTALAYFKVYHLAGLPQMIQDVGFGPLCLSALLLSMASGNRLWYVAILAAILLLAGVQQGGCRDDSPVKSHLYQRKGGGPSQPS